MKKRLLSFFLACCMVLTPLSALALSDAETGGAGTETESADAAGDTESVAPPDSAGAAPSDASDETAAGDDETATLMADSDFTINDAGTLTRYNGPGGDVVIPDGVTSIGNAAFYGCSALTSVTIPDSVTSIGYEAFRACEGLTSVTIPYGVTSIDMFAFVSCIGLISVTIPNSVTSIGDYAFSNCRLTSITIPDSLTSLSKYMFYKCRFKSVTIPDSVVSIGVSAFHDCSELTSVTIPDSVTQIGDGAFVNCNALTDVYYGGAEAQWNAVTIGENNPRLTGAVIHYNSAEAGIVAGGDCGDSLTWTLYADGVLLISGTGGMSNYTNAKPAPWADYRADIKTVRIGDGATSVGNFAFQDCAALTAVTIPDGVTKIGESAFSGCAALPGVALPDTLTSIGNAAFKGCSVLSAVTIPGAVATIGAEAFYDCVALTAVTIPDSVTSLGDSAFGGCAALTSVTIGTGLTEIPRSAFSGSGLTAVTIPDGVTRIGKYAFYHCASLASVTIPVSAATVTESAFDGCSALADVYYAGTETQWNAIAIGDSNEPLTDATLHCADANIVASGECGADGDNVTWTLYADGLLKIEGSGEMKGYANLSKESKITSAPWANYQSDIKNVQIENGVASIGNYAFEYCEALTSVTIPDSVTSIGKWAFCRCIALASVTISAGVTSIGDGAFARCSSLPEIICSAGNPNFSTLDGVLFNKQQTELIQYPAGKANASYAIPDGVTSIGYDAFYGCDALTSVTIPASVDNIELCAFANCGALTSVTMPASVTSIGKEAFLDCSALTDVYYAGTETQWNAITIGNNNAYLTGANIHYNSAGPETEVVASGECGADGDNVTWTLYSDGLLKIEGSGAMADFTGFDSTPWASYRNNIKTVQIGNGVTSIGRAAFTSCGGLTSVTIPDSVTNIGYDAFSCCSKLTSVTIPDSVIGIQDGAFSYCSEMKSVTIGNGVASIGERAFAFCEGLTSVKIPDSVTSIGNNAFTICSVLTEIIVSEDNPNYSMLDGVLFNKQQTELIQYPAGKTSASYVIPDSVAIIGSEAFGGCEGLISVTIPASVTSIGHYAFVSCIGLASVTIPNGVTSIKGATFQLCNSLANVTIPASVTSIESSAFYDCASLTDVYYGGTEEQWSAISVDNTDDGNAYLLNAAIHCNGAGPEAEIIASGECGADGDNVTWTLYSDGLLKIEGSGAMADYESYVSTPWTNYRSDIKTAQIGNGVTSIGENALSDCSGLTNVTIPDSVTNIGKLAFKGCGDGLTNITIPNSVTNIGNEAFRGCSGLTNVTIPNSVTSIGEAAFNNCGALTEITVHEDNPNYSALNGVLFDKQQTTLIQYPAGSSNATYAIPDSVTSIGAFAFDSCSGLTSVTMPNSVTSIGDCAFYNCYSLTNVTIPDSVTSIGVNAFYFSGLMSVTIPGSVTIIEVAAFSSCGVLTSVTILDGVTSINGGAFGACGRLTSVTIPASVASIEAHAFNSCRALTDVYYSGTEEQWNAISVDNTDDGNAYLLNATIHCNGAGPEADTEAPVAALSPATITVPVRSAVVFDASASADNVGVARYAWNFGDNSTDSGKDASVSHAFAAEGSYTVTLTVTDAAGNSDSATASVTVISAESAVQITALDTVSGKPVAGAKISVADGAEYVTGPDGKTFLSAENGTYAVSASADGYQDRSFSMQVTDENRAFTVYLNASDILRVETAVKELTKEEAVAAGIDVNASENQHVYRSTAVFEFGELTYIHNDSEVLDYTPLKTGRITAYPVARDIYLIVYSQVNWLKEIFRVQLYIQNTSNFERIENCSAKLTLPKGLSLAVMTEEKDPQSLEVPLGTIAPSSEIGHNWYLCGDEAGEYELSGAVFGVRANEDNTIREDTSADFTTSEKISVLAGDAMTLTITAEKYGVVGVPYHVVYELENVSEKTLYDVRLSVMGGKFVEDYDASDLEYDPDEAASGSLETGFSLYDETFAPGEKLTGVFTIRFGKGLDLRRGMEYVLKDMFSLTDETSTTEIPTIMKLTNNERILLSYDASGGGGEMEPKLVEKDAEASKFSYKLPGCSFTAPEGKRFKAWLFGGTEYAPGDDYFPTEDATLLAVWEDDEYEEGVKRKVTFDAAGGEMDAVEMSVTAGGLYGELPAPVREGYTFAGWHTAAEGGEEITASDTVTLSRDVTLYAHWTPIAYQITWVNDDGTELKTTEVPYGETPDYGGATPEKAEDAQYSYAFAGWTPEIAPVSGEATYRATYDAMRKFFTVTWLNYNGATLKTDANVPRGDTPAYDGETPRRAAVGATAYNFIGWTPEVVPANADASYTASYESVPRTYAIIWANEDGSALETDENVPYGQMPTYDGETPTKEADAKYAYVFNGWTKAVKPVSGDTTYMAAYARTLRTYTVTWLNEDGSTLETDENVPYGQTPAYDGETPTKEADPDSGEGYVFTKWTPEIEPVSGEATYTAVYRPASSSYIEEVSVSGETVTVTLDCFQTGAVALCAVYSEDGQVIALSSLPVSDGRLYRFQFDGCAFDYAKAFLIGEDMRSLCASAKSK